MAISKLNFSFTDGQTTIRAEHLNAFVDRINKLIDAVEEQPTPTQTVATPTISVNSGVVTIACATSGATIKYTTDGSTPSSSNGSTYSAAFTPAGDCTIKAIAIKSGMTDSQVVSQSYTSPIIDITSLFTNWTSGAIKYADGGTQGSTAYAYCDYVDISAYAGKTLNYTRMKRTTDTSSPVGLAFYDSSQQYISGQGLHILQAEDGWEDTDLEIPSNAKYIRLSWYNETGSYSQFYADFYAKIKG